MQQDGSCGSYTEIKKQAVGGKGGDSTDCGGFLEREGTLFGDMKGPGTKSIHRKRTDAWQEITDLLNS